MPGGRATHSYPNGTPFLLIALNAGWVIGLLVWLSSFPENKIFGSIALIYTLVVLGSINDKLHRRYEKTGKAVRIRPRIVFVKGLPLGMVGTRLAILMIVGVMLALGLAPISIDQAKPGIIACVISLFALIFLDFFLESRAIKAGDAKEVQ